VDEFADPPNKPMAFDADDNLSEEIKWLIGM
jgi:hypothetical protein